MNDRPDSAGGSGSSRQRYREFVKVYKRRGLDDPADPTDGDAEEANGSRKGKRREYLRAYLSRLRPHRPAVAAIVLVSLFVAGLEMIEPLGEWDATEVAIRDIPVGQSRHLVRFVEADGRLWALKELPVAVARREYRVLRELEDWAEKLAIDARNDLVAQGIAANEVSVSRRIHLKYEGTDTALVVTLGPVADMLAQFETAYRKQFSFLMPGRALIAEAVSVEAIAAGEAPC